MQLRQSLLAKNALRCLEDAQKQGYFDEYGTRANSVPTMILQVGLAQALGFLRAKSGEQRSTLERAYRRYYLDLVALARVAISDAPEEEGQFYAWVLSLDLGDYRRVTQAVLDGGVWLKRIYQGTAKSEGRMIG
ncbi:type III-B CRISPR module-associated protein Cmr5 [Acidithiobacillus caldus]